MSSDKDGRPYIPQFETEAQSNIEDKIVESMIMKLTEGKTWDKMYIDAMKQINKEEQISTKLERMLSETLENVNLDTEPYSEMLIKLGGPNLIKNISDEIRKSKDYDEVIKKLIELPEFNPSEELVKDICKNFDIIYESEMEDAYNSSRPLPLSETPYDK